MCARITLLCAAPALLLLLAATTIASATPQGRLLDGQAAAVGSHPYSASLQRDGLHICGATIVGLQQLLTAAHCVSSGSGIESYPARNFLVRVGSIQRLAGGQLVQISRIIIHKDYADGLNDLALLVLQQPLTLNANTQPIAVASVVPPAGSQVTYTGWGAQRTQGSYTHRLQVGYQKTLSADECEDQLNLKDDGLLCLVPTDSDDSNGLCAGDAGAPAVYQNELVGIGAFYVGGCGSSYPDGFVNVANYYNWIQENSA